jgi:hypothetical protein
MNARVVGVLASVWLIVWGSYAQEVTITSFDQTGRLTWTGPSNSDSTVEWMSCLTGSGKWERTWVNLNNVHSSNGTATADVPMFYRVMCWTNGLFARMPVGRTCIYSVSNAIGQVWTERIVSVGSLILPPYSNQYVCLSREEIYSGSQPEGSLDNTLLFFRSTDHAIYGLVWPGQEEPGWKDGPIGTTWTNVLEGSVETLETNETVVVPAGTFTDCLKYRKSDAQNPQPQNTWYEWVKPGFFMVKWMDYYLSNQSAAPVVYQLQSWRDDPPPPPGLIAWWKADGTTSDSVGTNHGSLSNGASYATGVFGQSFAFDGEDDFVEVPHSDTLSFPPGSEATLGFWFCQTRRTFPVHFLGKRLNNFSDSFNYQVAFGGGSPPLPTNEWIHVAQVYSTNGVFIYTDGALFATDPVGTFLATNSAPLRIGTSDDVHEYGQSFGGLIDDVRIYNRALSLSEIQAIVSFRGSR